MALQSSVRSSLLAVKLGSCAKPKTCASSRHRQMLTFDEAGELRQKQAKQSLLFQVQSPKSAGPLGAVLEKYGTVSNLFHFTSEKKEFLFVEMSSRAEAEEVIRHAHHPAADTVVPVSSPLLWFRAGGRGQPAAEADAALPPIVQEPSRSEAELARRIAECPTLDEQLVRHHELTRLTELGARLRYFTCELLERALAGLFPHARARPFGSSANGFGRYDCDVDMVLELAPARPETSERLAFQTMAAKPDGRVQTQRYLSIISDMMATLMPGCSQVRRILKARVPIVKYTQSFTGIDCDLSMQRNGLHMTELLYVWAQLDQRVAPLVRAVRHWAEKIHLTNAISGSSGAGRWISNFGITLLVIYFLQTRPVPVLPSVNELTQRARPGDSAEVDGAVYSFLRDPSLVPPSANSESLSQLLAAFFAFYGELDLDARAISVVWAGDFPRPAGGPLHVQNPLDRELNVTKNVTGEEVRRLGAEARRAGRLLREGRWWPLLLDGDAAAGEPLSPPLSVRALFEDDEPAVCAGAGQTAAQRPPADEPEGRVSPVQDGERQGDSARDGERRGDSVQVPPAERQRQAVAAEVQHAAPAAAAPAAARTAAPAVPQRTVSKLDLAKLLRSGRAGRIPGREPFPTPPGAVSWRVNPAPTEPEPPVEGDSADPGTPERKPKKRRKKRRQML